MIERMMTAGWGDMDFNGHMRNTAYLDRSADMRMMFFAANGFTMDELKRLKLGPVVQKDEIEYQREVGLLGEIRGTMGIDGLAADGSRWRIRNEFYRADGKLAARVTSVGGWLDLAARRLVVPPPPLLAALRQLPRTETFEELGTSVR